MLHSYQRGAYNLFHYPASFPRTMRPPVEPWNLFSCLCGSFRLCVSFWNPPPPPHKTFTISQLMEQYRKPVKMNISGNKIWNQYIHWQPFRSSSQQCTSKLRYYYTSSRKACHWFIGCYSKGFREPNKALAISPSASLLIKCFSRAGNQSRRRRRRQW